MEVTLSPAAEALVLQKMKSGYFESPSQLIETALHALVEYTTEERAAFDKMIQEGLDEIERGEVFTEDEARAYLGAMRAKL